MRVLPPRIQLPVSIAGIIAVLVLGVMVADSTADMGMATWFNEWNTGVVGAIANFVYGALQPVWSFTFCAIGIATYLAFRKPVRPLLAFVVTVIAAWLPVILLKKVFTRPRIDFSLLPNPPDYLPRDWSYPSGHTAFIVGLCVALLLATYGTSALRIVRILAPLPIIAIVACVLITGVHYPTDAAGSLIWAFTVGPLAWMGMAKVIADADPGPTTIVTRPGQAASPFPTNPPVKHRAERLPQQLGSLSASSNIGHRTHVSSTEPPRQWRVATKSPT